MSWQHAAPILLDPDGGNKRLQPLGLASGADAVAEAQIQALTSTACQFPAAGGEQLDGVLMDVDLSDVPGEHGSGPGIAQDIRINQENGRLRPFPIVRFSSRAKVLANIGGDSSSDDLFDLKIDKEAAPRDIVRVRKRLIGCSEIYHHVVEAHSFAPEELANFLALTVDALESWTHPEFIARAASADKPHIAAGLMMRFLTQPGPLISEVLMAVRLGVDATSSGWPALRDSLSPVKYIGKGHEYFELWWARGLEDWWLDCEGADTPLSSMTIDQRVAQLSQKHGGFTTPPMPGESPGSRPWRLCTLSLEEEDPAVVPVDPAFGVRMATRGNVAPWVDPSYAAYGIALQKREDRRLNRADLERLAAQLQT
jgi:hypothetical protein